MEVQQEHSRSPSLLAIRLPSCLFSHTTNCKLARLACVQVPYTTSLARLTKSTPVHQCTVEKSVAHTRRLREEKYSQQQETFALSDISVSTSILVSSIDEQASERANDQPTPASLTRSLTRFGQKITNAAQRRTKQNNL